MKKLLLALVISASLCSCYKSKFITPSKCAEVTKVTAHYYEPITTDTVHYGVICGKDLDSTIYYQHQHYILCIDGSREDIDYIIKPIN